MNKTFLRSVLSGRASRSGKPSYGSSGRRSDGDAFRTIPSLDTGYCDTSPKDKHSYSGTSVLGIALLHKQGYTPVTSQDDAIAVARMRRS